MSSSISLYLLLSPSISFSSGSACISSEPVSRVLYSSGSPGDACHLSTGSVTAVLYRSTLRLGRAALSFMFAGLHELSTPGVHSTDITAGLVSSCLTFSPLPLPGRGFPPFRFGRLFSSVLSGPCGPLPVRKRDALCCPDFPLPLPSLRGGKGQRQAGSLLMQADL